MKSNEKIKEKTLGEYEEEYTCKLNVSSKT